MKLVGTILALIAHTLPGGAAQILPPTSYFGMCDASGAVAVSADRFVICDDEDNRLRLYHVNRAGLPEKIFDMTAFLRVDPKEPEVDLEGAARIGDRVYWITSHGRNKNGKFRESRLRFFATAIERRGAEIDLRPVGRFYSHLLADVLRDRRLKGFGLDVAAQLPPKAPGGFNIEGLTATPDGKLLFGFRSPVPAGQALLVPLLNPEEAIAGQRARLGDPIRLDLAGRGVRAIALYGERYVIIAGASDGSARSRIYLWAGGHARPERLDVAMGSLNPEAVAIYPDRPGFQIISDDGTQLVNGVPCKECPDQNLKRFRGAFIVP